MILSTLTLFELLKIIVTIIQTYTFYPNIQLIFSLFSIFITILLLGIECYKTQFKKIKDNDIYLHYFENSLSDFKTDENILKKTYQYAFKKLLCIFVYYFYINSLFLLFVYHCCTKYFLTSYQGSMISHILIIVLFILLGLVLYTLISFTIDNKYHLKEIDGKSTTYLCMTYYLLQCRGNSILLARQALLNSVVVLIRHNDYEKAFNFLNLWKKHNQKIPVAYQLVYNQDMCIVTLMTKHEQIFLQYYQDYQNILNQKPKLKEKPLAKQTSALVSICYDFYNHDYQQVIHSCNEYIKTYHKEPDFLIYFMYIAFLATQKEAAKQLQESHLDNPLIHNEKNS